MNLTPLPDDKTQGRFRTKSGWITLTPVQLTSSQKISFPLYNSEVYTIGGDESCDVVLPIDNNTKLKVQVHSPKRRQNCSACICDVKCQFYCKIAFQTVSTQVKDKEITLIDHVLKSNKKVFVDFSSQSHADLKIGPFEFFLCKGCAPNYDFLCQVTLIGQCCSCSSLWIASQSLPCGHMICMECLTRLCQKTTYKLDELLSSRSVNEETLQAASKVQCPQCQFVMPYVDAMKINTEPILSSMEELMPPLYKNEKLFCADCDNVRCIANKDDFWKCFTCRCFCCPLCVLELHRSHRTENVYSMTTTDNLAYNQKKCLTVNRYHDLLFVKTIGAVSASAELLSTMSTCSNEIEDSIDRILTQAKDQHTRLDYLESLLSGDSIDTERMTCVQLFEAMILTMKDDIRKMVVNFNRTVNVINKTGEHWKSPSWCEPIVPGKTLYTRSRINRMDGTIYDTIDIVYN